MLRGSVSSFRYIQKNLVSPSLMWNCNVSTIFSSSLFSSSICQTFIQQHYATTTSTINSTEVKPIPTALSTSTSEGDAPKRGNLIFVTLTKSIITEPPKVKNSIKALGLSRPNDFQVYVDTPKIRGLLYAARNILDIQIVNTSELYPNGVPNQDSFVYKNREQRIQALRQLRAQRKKSKVENRCQELQNLSKEESQ